MTDKKIPGMTLVDNYWIPDEDLKQYLDDRHHFRKKIIAYAQEYFPKVTTEFQGTEDGEAVVAYREDGSFRFLMHLDPMRIDEMKEAERDGELEAYFIDVCEITETKLTQQPNRLRLVAIDMDATLLRDDKTYDEERFDRVAAELDARGVKLMIASGNSYPKLDYYLSHMDREHIYFAADNGNYIRLGDEVIRQMSIDGAEIQEVIGFLESQGKFSILFSDGLTSYTKWIDPEFEDYIYIYYDHLVKLNDYSELGGLPIFKIASHSPRDLDEMKKIVEAVMRKFPNLSAVTSGGGWIDIYHADGGKGSAVQFIQDQYEISPSETMVFGDSLNDESMFHVADYSVAMANADDALKKIASYEIGTNEEQSVIDVLEQYLEEDSLDMMEKYRR